MAVDVGGTSVKGALLDRRGRVLTERRVRTPVDEGPERVIAAIEDVAAELADIGSGTVRAAGVAVPGQVDPVAGVARYAANLGLRDAPLRDRVAARLGLPVVLTHDVRAASVAERDFGAARGVRNVVVVVIGTGIAATLVCDDRPLGGDLGLAGELGHVPVRPGGERCPCGQRGCLEVYASASGIARRYRAAGGADPGDLGAAAVVQRLTTDAVAARIWDEAIAALVTALVTATMLADPELFVLGGGLSAAGGKLLEPLRHGVAGGLTWRPAPRIALSPLGESAGRLGAGLLAWRLADEGR